MAWIPRTKLRCRVGRNMLLLAFLSLSCSKAPDAAPEPSPTSAKAEPDLHGQEGVSILFDAHHGQLDGLPRWQVDDDLPVPRPLVPQSAEDWDGVLSSLAFVLHRSGARILQSDGPFVYGACADRAAWSRDLACHDLVVLVEPDRLFQASEILALRSFVQDGGGLLMAAWHYGSNRQGVPCDGDGQPAPVGPERKPAVPGDQVDSTAVLAQLSEFSGVEPSGGVPSPCIGGDPVHAVANNNVLERNRRFSQPTDPLLKGPAGSVHLLDFELATTFHSVKKHQAKNVTPVVRSRRESRGVAQAWLVVRSEFGRGRMVALGDSTLFSDGTSSMERGPCRLRDPERPKQDGDRLLLNAIAWLTRGQLATATRPEMPTLDLCRPVPREATPAVK